MKITSVELFQVPRAGCFEDRQRQRRVGLGRAHRRGPGGHGQGPVEEPGYLIGRDPRQVEDIWQVLYRAGPYRGGPVLQRGLGIDQALGTSRARTWASGVRPAGRPGARQDEGLGWIGGDRPSHVAEQAKAESPRATAPSR